MAVKLGEITLHGISIISIDVAPDLILGMEAPIGSLATCVDGSGVFYKFGILSTNWKNLAFT